MGNGRVFGGAAGHGGAGYNYHVPNIIAEYSQGNILLKWRDPCDDEWCGTKIVRKEGRYPDTIEDGILLLDNTEHDHYATDGYLDTGLSTTARYYYKAFPYSQKGVNTSYLNQVSPDTPSSLSYSGKHTVATVVHEGKTWEQWTFTSSGVLTRSGGNLPNGKVWLCSGGSSGYDTYGGNGGFARSEDDVHIDNKTVIVVGAGGTVAKEPSGGSSFGSITVDGVARVTSNSIGGSGGGGSGGGSGGRGDGMSKYPFNDTVYFKSRPHCAGGGSGGIYDYWDGSIGTYSGGGGGSNGGNGGSSSYTGQNGGGSGGLYGGGRGGNAELTGDLSTAGTFYGAGGGGKAKYTDEVNKKYNKPSGVCAGYQGVVYLRIPINNA